MSPVRVQRPGRQQSDPEQELLLADSVGLALLVVLDTLEPAERLAFVLHDTFAVPFDEIARITGRSAAAARQLASRARRRVRGRAPAPNSDLTRRRKIVEAFFAAARGGDFERLVALLDPNVVLRADREALPAGARAAEEVRGAAAVAERALAGRTKFAEVAAVDGEAAVVVISGGRQSVDLRRALLFTIRRDRIVAIDVVANRGRLRRLKITPLPS